MNAKTIGEGSIEDFLDESLEECLLTDFYQFLNSQNPDDKDNCLTIASVNTLLSVGRMTAMWVSFKVTEKVATGIINRASAYWIYIEAGRLGKYVHSKVKAKPKSFFGKAGGFLFRNIVGADQTGNRIEKMKLIQSELDRFDTHSFEYQKILGGNRHALNKRTELALNTKKDKKVQFAELARHKTLTSTWTNSTHDKRIFESVMGAKVSNVGKESWSNKYKQLNQLSTFAKDVEGNMFSQSQVLLDLFLMERMTKVR